MTGYFDDSFAKAGCTVLGSLQTEKTEWAQENGQKHHATINRSFLFGLTMRKLRPNVGSAGEDLHDMKTSAMKRDNV